MNGRDEISIFDLWDVVSAKRVLIVVVSASVFLLALAYAFLSTPIYRAQTVLIEVQPDQSTSGLAALAGQFGGLASLAGVRTSTNSLKLEALATIRSRVFLEEFIVEMDIMPHLFRDRWDAVNKQWNVSDPSEIPTVSKAFEYFREKVLSVSDVTEQGLVTVTIDTDRAENAADWANALVHRLNQKLRQRSIVEARKNIEYLNEELNKTSVVELQHAIHRMIENQINTIMLANVREEYAFRIIDPAKAADPGNFLKPRRFLIIAIGAIGGALAGLFLALFIHGFQKHRSMRLQNRIE
ncbi:MAG: Wzz/FepE/Etk N-terminal domain-containing protein [Gammaproteobacteria bacterium]|nr:Wzz/FepE/Etk N-terminal domain-containing protein [Gammaproteobacteria bacterium]